MLVRPGVVGMVVDVVVPGAVVVRPGDVGMVVDVVVPGAVVVGPGVVGIVVDIVVPGAVVVTTGVVGLQESLNALKSILKEIDSQAFEKALEKKDQNKIFVAIQNPGQVKKDKSKM